MEHYPLSKRRKIYSEWPIINPDLSYYFLDFLDLDSLKAFCRTHKISYELCKLFKEQKKKHFDDLIMEEKFSNFLPIFLEIVSLNRTINFHARKKNTDIIMKTFFVDNEKIQRRTLVIQSFSENYESIKKFHFKFDQEKNTIKFNNQQDYVECLKILLDFIKSWPIYRIYIMDDHSFNGSGRMHRLLVVLEERGSVPYDSIFYNEDEEVLVIEDGFTFFDSIPLRIFKNIEKPSILF
jgi:hypothetical protein